MHVVAWFLEIHLESYEAGCGIFMADDMDVGNELNVCKTKGIKLLLFSVYRIEDEVQSDNTIGGDELAS